MALIYYSATMPAGKAGMRGRQDRRQEMGGRDEEVKKEEGRRKALCFTVSPSGANAKPDANSICCRSE